MGARGRLILAFFEISAFAVLAADAAMYSCFEVGQAIDRVTQQRVPAALVSQKLSQQAESIVFAAPVLLTLDTAEELEELFSSITADFERLSKTLDVSTLAEARPHHPQWTNVWNRVDVRLRTFDAGQLVTWYDIEMASKMNKIATRIETAENLVWPISPSI